PPARATGARSRADDLRRRQRDGAQDRGGSAEPRRRRVRLRRAPAARPRASRRQVTPASAMPLPRRFYLRPARAVARDLLGCVLASRRGSTITAGSLVEPEPYLGLEDAASLPAFRPATPAGRPTIAPPDRPRDFRIASGPRVAITRSVELRRRFWIAGNSYVSPPRSASK